MNSRSVRNLNLNRSSIRVNRDNLCGVLAIDTFADRESKDLTPRFSRELETPSAGAANAGEAARARIAKIGSCIVDVVSDFGLEEQTRFEKMECFVLDICS